MNSERGFVTIFALCLIVVVALVVKGIQETDANRNTAADILLVEFDLQNEADGGIYEAAEKVRSGQKDLPASSSSDTVERKKNQIQLVSRSVTSEHGTISVKVWGERLHIQDYNRLYPSYKKNPVKYSNNKDIIHYGYVLFGVAQLNNPRFGKMYRRAFAYVIDGYGVEYYYRPFYAKNGYRPVEPKPESMIDGTEDEQAVYYEELDKYLVVVADKDKDVVHFMTLPSGKDN